MSHSLVSLNKFSASVLQVITEELGLNLEKVDTDMLGSCKKVSSNFWLWYYSIRHKHKQCMCAGWAGLGMVDFNLKRDLEFSIYFCGNKTNEARFLKLKPPPPFIRK